MPLVWIIAIILAIAAIGFLLGRRRVLQAVQGDRRKLHSLPNYYGSNVLISALVPALLLLIIWLTLQPIYVNSLVSSGLSVSDLEQAASPDLVMAEIRRTADGLELAVASGTMTEDLARDPGADITEVAEGLQEAGSIVTSAVTQPILRAAQQYRAIMGTGYTMMFWAVVLMALGGAFWGLRNARPDYRARHTVEQAIRALLVAAASIAILTTLGIILSLIFNTIEFFRLYPATEFFFGTNWAPSFSGRGGASDLGVLPLLWGTFYISIVALTVAIPIGLFAAIYLSEYASPRVRAMAKPALEVLAGIPTIVYGLFALLTVGPLLMKVFGPDALGIMQAGTAVMTAGLVMGIMLIPFVSSLSDDIINAVPQAMRDGSYGLGATKSETIRKVILPAALPGVVGAILLAASRAIGETMIVVLGAGAAARLSLNPFDAMTTVTAKIVSQLTGDADFASPEALVAFALGMTLFVITLGLNIIALTIVRKYREQYD
ncbi:MAG: phosphate ABC transporter permease subunit PstC [Sulfitobacter sp.]|nr:phosphate ABC transporter permease subunit PstC [Sulfitobacter sp.]